jgi:L-ectoine synthase
MIHRSSDQLAASPREAYGDGWASRRFLLAEDGRPFSFHETTVRAGTELRIDYRHHTESVYCVRGRASVEHLSSGRVFTIEPGTFYSVGVGEAHVLRIEEDTTFVCVFDPPLRGREEAD